MKAFVRNNKKIHISETVIEIFERYKQNNKKDNESGGILIGQIKDNNIYILKASIPNKFDKSSRYYFECNKDAAQIIINYEFYNSNQKSIYIGEWHTHPEKDPTPSNVDKNMIIKQFKNNKLNEPFLILIIQGLKNIYVSLYDGKNFYEE